MTISPDASPLFFRNANPRRSEFGGRLECLGQLHELRDDIRFGIKGRTWLNCDGHENFPDGEVFTGPIENATEGVVHYSFPAVHGGREVNNVRLAFKAGKVVEASADSNEEFLIQMLDQDKGARVLGELALGDHPDVLRYIRVGGTRPLAIHHAVEVIRLRRVCWLHVCVSST